MDQTTPKSQSNRNDWPEVWMFDCVNIERLGWSSWRIAGVGRTTINGQWTGRVAQLIRARESVTLIEDAARQHILYDHIASKNGLMDMDPEIRRVLRSYPPNVMEMQFFKTWSDTPNANSNWEWTLGNGQMASNWLKTHTYDGVVIGISHFPPLMSAHRRHAENEQMPPEEITHLKKLRNIVNTKDSGQTTGITKQTWIDILIAVACGETTKNALERLAPFVILDDTNPTRKPDAQTFTLL